MSDPFHLGRFVAAQASVYDEAIAELRAGRKASHWMWFVFPQLAGLGRSATAQRYAVASLEEAQAYLAYPLLGSRLRECVGILLRHETLTAHAVFGSPDDLKLRSSLTLFAQAAGNDPLFPEALNRYFAGQPDPETLRRLRQAPWMHPFPAPGVHSRPSWTQRSFIVAGVDAIKEHMEVIGADGVHVGTVDRVDGNRIKLTKKDSGEGSHEGYHHYLPLGLVADVEGDKVRLSANGDVASELFEEEQ